MTVAAESFIAARDDSPLSTAAGGPGWTALDGSHAQDMLAVYCSVAAPRMYSATSDSTANETTRQMGRRLVAAEVARLDALPPAVETVQQRAHRKMAELTGRCA